MRKRSTLPMRSYWNKRVATSFPSARFHTAYNKSKRKRGEPAVKSVLKSVETQTLKIKFEVEESDSETEQRDPDILPVPIVEASRQPVSTPASFTLRVESTGVPDTTPPPPSLENFETELSRLEAVLFIAKEPWNLRRLAQYAHIKNSATVRELIEQLNKTYRSKKYPFRVLSVAGGYSLMVRPQFSPWLRRIHGGREKQLKLTPSAKETLAVVAFKQPVLRVDIESIRGVQCGESLRNLMDCGFIRIVGRSDDLGRPFLYGTTKLFLSVYGLNSLDDLLGRPKPSNSEKISKISAISDNFTKEVLSDTAIKTEERFADNANCSEKSNNSNNNCPATPAVGVTDGTINPDASESESSNLKESSMLHTISMSMPTMGNGNLWGSTIELGDSMSSTAVMSSYDDDEENGDWDDDDDDDDDWDDEDDDDDDWDDEDDEEYDDDDEEYDDWEEVEDDEDEDDEDWDDEDWDDEDEDDDEDWDEDDEDEENN